MVKNNFGDMIKVASSQFGSTASFGSNKPKPVKEKVLTFSHKNRFSPRAKQRAHEARLREEEKKVRKQQKIQEQAEKRGKKIGDDRRCIKLKKAA